MGKKQIKNVILDTNIIFELLHENAAFLDEIDKIGTDYLFVCSISTLETFYGMRKNEERKTKELFNRLNRIYIDKEIGRKAESLMFQYRGQRPKIPDCLIAATALCFNMELFTLNRKDFDYIRGVKFYNPQTSPLEL
jgi:tRNA(fMet)-specific endonuclease VapC